MNMNLCGIVVYLVLSLEVVRIYGGLSPDGTIGTEKPNVPAALSEDEYLSFLHENDDFLRNISLSIFPMFNDENVSGEFLPENDTEDIGMQEVMDMLFTKPLFDSNDTPAESGTKESENALERGKQRLKKSSGEKKTQEKKQQSHEELLTAIETILSENSNATFRVENGRLTVEGSLFGDKYQTLATICGLPVKNVADFEELFENMSVDEKNKIAKLFGKYSKGNITKLQFTHRISKYADKVQCFSTTTTIPSTTSSRFEYQLAELREIVEAGYASKSLLRDVEEGKLTIDDVLAILMKDKKFVFSRFPPKVEEMFEDDRIPDHIVAVMFSGNFTLDELKFVIYQNDVIAKGLLPERVRDILENRYPSQPLKNMLYEEYNHSTIQKMVMTNETLLEDLMSESMFYFFTLFKVQRNVMLNMALSATTIVALCCVMASLGCTMTVTEIMQHVRRPKGVLIALVSQYGIMPAAAFGLTQVFNLGVYPAIAVLICGCCPGGNLSNILAFAINGDMNLSILMTTCSSVLGLAMMPLLLFCYSRFIIPVDGSEIVPFDKIILNIVLTIVPVCIGIAIKHYRPTWTKNVMRFGATMLLICSITFSVLAGFLLGDKFFSYFPIEVVICAAILPITGYVMGFVLARLARENQKCSRTISVETGCQNVQLCGTVLKLAFDPILIGAVMLLPIIYMAFQAGEAILLISFYRLYERCTKKKMDEEEIKFDDEEKKLERSDSETKDAEQIDEDLNREKEDDIEQPEQKGDRKTKNKGVKEENSDACWPLVPDSSYLDALENGKENCV